ncbi:MAG: GNAT family protein [Planctomycetota bacterium]
MINIIPFKPEHMADIEKKDINSGVLEFIGDIDSRAVIYANSGPAITMLKRNTLLAIGGVLQFWTGVGEAWMMVSPEGRKSGLALYRVMERFLNMGFEKYGFHRIQASVVNGYTEAHKVVLRLGFIPEGMMVQYGPNKENYVRYVRLK